MKNEFEEIAHAGGKIEFALEEGYISTRISSSSPYPFSLIQVCVSYDGKLLDFVPFGGIGSVPIHPQPSRCVTLISDREGMWGRHCPKCDSYFRAKEPGRHMSCTYCGFRANNVEFTTPSQKKFLEHYLNAQSSVTEENANVVLDIRSILDDLNSQNPEWLYSEERQQSLVKCVRCGNSYDILGQYGSCSGCSKYNGDSVFNDIMDSMDAHFTRVENEIHDRESRSHEWEKFVRCISEFEALGNDIVRRLLTYPMTNRRRNELGGLSFQRIGDAVGRLDAWYAIKIWDGFQGVDIEFLKLMFQRRHIFAHQAGRVDQEYINNTGDQTVRVGQILRLRSRDVKRLLPLLRLMGSNLVGGFEEIWGQEK